MERNPIITLNNQQVRLIGDPHLGRKFDTNTPLERRGEREAAQQQRFFNLVVNSEEQDIIIMGDIFDKMKISNEVLINTAITLLGATDKRIYILRGNHDASKDQSLVSSFDVLEQICESRDNIHFVKQAMLFPALDAILVGYDPFQSSSELLSGSFPKVAAAFTHNDLDSFGGTDFNLMQYDKLKEFTDTVYNGHVHKPEVRTYEGLTIHNVGSMEPYAHGEQLAGEMYVSMTLEDYLKNPEGTHDKCLRLLLKPGEKVPEGIDALNISSKLITDKDVDVEVEVKFEDFDFQQLFITTLRDAGVLDNTISTIWSKYEELKNVEQ